MSSPSLNRSYVPTFYFFILSLLMSVVFYGAHYLFKIRNNNNYTNSPSSPQSKSNRSSQNTISLVVLNGSLLISLTCLWYAISITFTFYNKWLLNSYKGGFTFPFTITTGHMVSKYIFSRFWVYFVMGVDSVPPLRSDTYVSVIIPIGITTALDIGLSNLSITSLSISLYTIMKTTVVAWTFLWSVVFGLETFGVMKLLYIFGLILGLSLALMNNLSASHIGLLAVIVSASCGGLRWVYVQLLYTHDALSKSSIIAVHRFAGVTVLCVAPLALFFEYKTIASTVFASSWQSIIEVTELIILGGILGCGLIIVELNLLLMTSSLTLSVLGELKEVVQIILSLISFHDKFTWVSGVGLVFAVTSAELYRREKSSEVSASLRPNWSYEQLDETDSSINLDVDDLELMKLMNDTDEDRM